MRDLYQLTIEEAEARAGFRLDRRRTYYLDGHWVRYIAYTVVSCSGCVELGEYGGGSDQYPVDPVFGCLVGGGCEECGYTGKRREYYPVSAEPLEKQRRAHPMHRREDRETLERIKRWPALLDRFDTVRIYSAEHHAYWREEAAGYTTNPNESPAMSAEIAYQQTRHCGPEKKIQYVRVSLFEDQ